MAFRAAAAELRASPFRLSAGQATRPRLRHPRRAAREILGDSLRAAPCLQQPLRWQNLDGFYRRGDRMMVDLSFRHVDGIIIGQWGHVFQVLSIANDPQTKVLRFEMVDAEGIELSA